MALIEPYASKLPYHVSIGSECFDMLADADAAAATAAVAAASTSATACRCRRSRCHHPDWTNPPTHLPTHPPPTLHPPTHPLSLADHEYDYDGPSHGLDPSGAAQQWRPSWFNGFTDSQGECGVGVDRRFRMPANGNGVFWYSFSVGNVHVAMISSEHDPTPSAPMGAWLVKDLAAVNRSETPWVFVNIHRPLVETEKYQACTPRQNPAHRPEPPANSP